MSDISRNVGIPVSDFDRTLVCRQGCTPLFKIFDDLLHTFHPEFQWLWCDKITAVRRETGFTSDRYVVTLHYTGEARPEKPPLIKEELR